MLTTKPIAKNVEKIEDGRKAGENDHDADPDPFAFAHGVNDHPEIERHHQEGADEAEPRLDRERSGHARVVVGFHGKKLTDLSAGWQTNFALLQLARAEPNLTSLAHRGIFGVPLPEPAR